VPVPDALRSSMKLCTALAVTAVWRRLHVALRLLGAAAVGPAVVCICCVTDGAEWRRCPLSTALSAAAVADAAVRGLDDCRGIKREFGGVWHVDGLIVTPDTVCCSAQDNSDSHKDDACVKYV
jgi:hypothetical protein